MSKTPVAAVVVAAIVVGWGGSASAQALTVPTQEEAKGAMLRLFDDPNVTRMMAKGGQVVIGTCVKTTKATKDGEIACTLAVEMGAGSWETQANFYKEGGQWTATPTEEKLPFPDPKLR